MEGLCPETRTQSMMAYLEGMAYGLVFIFSFGPAFLALMQTAMQVGFRRAIMVSLGVNTTDALWISIVLVGLGPLLEGALVQQWMGWLGVVVLLLFGIFSLRKTFDISTDAAEDRKPFYLYYLKGVALNGLNPLIAFFWVGIVGTVSALGHTTGGMFAFFGGLLSTVVMVDVTKAFLIRRLAHRITPRVLRMINRAVGLVFIFFGFRLAAFLVWGV